MIDLLSHSRSPFVVSRKIVASFIYIFFNKIGDNETIITLSSLAPRAAMMHWTPGPDVRPCVLEGASRKQVRHSTLIQTGFGKTRFY